MFFNKVKTPEEAKRDLRTAIQSLSRVLMDVEELQQSYQVRDTISNDKSKMLKDLVVHVKKLREAGNFEDRPSFDRKIQALKNEYPTCYQESFFCFNTVSTAVNNIRREVLNVIEKQNVSLGITPKFTLIDNSPRPT